MLVGNPAVQVWESTLVIVGTGISDSTGTVHVIIDWCQGRDLVMKVSRFLLE